MGYVIGPTEGSAQERLINWCTMQMLHASIKVMKERNTTGKFRQALNKEYPLYGYYKDHFMSGQVAA